MSPQGNQPLRFPTIYDIFISKTEMNQLFDTGILKAIDQNGFVIYDTNNVDGSHVHWSNLKEIRIADDSKSLHLIYNNLSDEVLTNQYQNWNELITNIPEDFGDFQKLLKTGDELEPTPEETELLDVDDAKEMLSNINQMREEFMEEDYEELVEEDEPESPEPEVIEEEEPVLEETEQTPEYSVEPQETVSASNEELLKKILAEAETGSSYSSYSYQKTNDEEEPKETAFTSGSEIQEANSLGFKVLHKGELLEIDFGKFSDAWYDETQELLVLEHRYGKTYSFSRKMAGWKVMIQKMPFRFRSFDRKQLWELAK